MAQLKDLLVNGATRLIGNAYANTIQITTLNAPTTSGGNTYGPGGSGKLLKSNGTSIFWGDPSEYELPKATASTLGGVTIGSGITVSDGQISVTASGLGLSNVMHFVGSTTTTMSDGLTTSSITVNGSSHTASAGDVVLYNDGEYVWTGTAWELLGDSNSFKVKQTAISAATTASTTTATTFVYNINQDTNGNISYETRTLPEHQTIIQDGVTGATVNRYATCTTSAGTTAKVANITSGTFNLETGATVTVKFSNTNTAANPTLNVNNTGAKKIMRYGTTTASTTTATSWYAGTAVTLVYDGTNWLMSDWGARTDNNTDTKVTQNATTASTWRKILLNGGSNNTYADWNTAIGSAVTDVAYCSYGISVQPSTNTLKANNLTAVNSMNLESDNYEFGFTTSGTNYGVFDLTGNKWAIVADSSNNWTLNGNANTATALSTTGTTAQFWRGDNSWASAPNTTYSFTVTDGNLVIAENS